MDQDDKVSAAAFSLSSTSGSVRISRALGADDGRDGAFREVEVVAGGSATESEAPSGGPGTQGSEASELSEDAPAASQPAEPDDSKTPKKASNNVRRIRIERMMSKAELARRANLSVLTIDRVERGYGCRVDTKRKILEALGLSLADRVRVFGEEE